MSDVDRLAGEMQARRTAFGYEYRCAEYARTPELCDLWERCAPWVTGSMVQTASNLSQAILRDVAPYLPVHDHD